MKSAQEIHDLVCNYIKEKNLQDTFIVGLADDEVVIYECKKDAMAKFEKNNLKIKFKRYLKFIVFRYIGKIVM